MEIIKRKKRTSYKEKVHVGNGKYISKCFHRKTDARIWKEETEKEIREGNAQFLRNKIKFRELIEEWFTLRVEKNKAVRTVDTYKRYKDNKLVPFFGNMKIRDISQRNIVQFQGHLISSGHSNKGVNLIMECLVQVLNYATSNGMIRYNPCKSVRKLKEQMKQDSFLSELEIRSFLLRAQRSKYYLIYTAAIYTGMRKGELGGLKWDRVDLLRRRIEVTRTRDNFGLRETTKSNLKRVVPISSEFMPLMQGAFNKRCSDYVFVDSNGRPLNINHLYRDLKNVLEEAGIERKLSFHDLRHTFASQFMMKGGNIYTLQKLLGHSSLNMTMRYAHLGQDYLQDVMEIMKFQEEVQVRPVTCLKTAHI